MQKLYDYSFNNTLEDIYKQWVQHRAETQIVSQKTIEEDIGIWNRFIADTELARMQIAEIKPVHIMKLFQIWTGNGKITRKDFNNRKSVLNGIFRHAALNEIITFSPITDLPCNTLKFKLPNASKMLFDAGVKAIDIQPLLGHSNLAMTQHYIGQRTTERDSTEMARILA